MNIRKDKDLLLQGSIDSTLLRAIEECFLASVSDINKVFNPNDNSLLFKIKLCPVHYYLR